jgi:multiple sugar transport system permease protein
MRTIQLEKDNLIDKEISKGSNFQPEKPKKKRVNLRREIIGTVMAAPPFIGFLCFTLFPMILSLYVSFHSLHSYNVDMAEWVGFENYTRLFGDKKVLEALGNTLRYCLSVPINLIVSVFLANLISKNIHGSKFYRVVMFLPQVCSMVAVTMMWQWIFTDTGVINTMLSKAGMSKIGFMTDPEWFPISLLIISLWKNGTNVVVLEAAFANTNKTLEEAASLDGANSLQMFWKVKFPQLTPTIFYLLTMLLLGALQEQALMQVLAGTIGGGEGAGSKGLTLVYYIYRMTNSYRVTMGMGMSCALSWLTAIFILLITRLNFWLSKFWVSYDV